jgi:hypothetical protein
VEERRECRIARSPEVPSADVSAGFSPLYGKKKGVGERETPVEMGGDRLRRAATFDPRHGIGLKAQKKNGSGRGRMRAGAGSYDEQRTLQFTPKICGGRFLGTARISVAYYSSMTNPTAVDEIRCCLNRHGRGASGWNYAIGFGLIAMGAFFILRGRCDACDGGLRVHPWCECVNGGDDTLPIFHLLVMIAKGGDRHICAATAETLVTRGGIGSARSDDTHGP